MLLYFKRVLLLLLIIIFLLIMLSIVFPIDSSSSSISNLEVSSRPFLALDTVEVDGRMLVPLEQISRPLDLSYAVNGETLLLSKAISYDKKRQEPFFFPLNHSYYKGPVQFTT
ncbi:hypothetical protein Psch_01345 [Pelotomaculum schinkii]|uniref:Uncharacterized protein n=1 Tax=Pelotomaculum schinkii TaxID=78350 RepID=A0A4Y7RGB4_9FIRM|nr:hypothetical protein Psch_01345 [Pelotomaculum schinkii]